MNCTHHPSHLGRASAGEQRTETESPIAHWIVETSYGRDLLFSRLRWLQPHARFSALRPDAKSLQGLEQMVHELGFRNWAPPHTRIERARVTLFFLAYNLRVSFGFRAPDWRSRFAQGRS